MNFWKKLFDGGSKTPKERCSVCGKKDLSDPEYPTERQAFVDKLRIMREVLSPATVYFSLMEYGAACTKCGRVYCRHCFTPTQGWTERAVGVCKCGGVMMIRRTISHMEFHLSQMR